MAKKVLSHIFRLCLPLGLLMVQPTLVASSPLCQRFLTMISPELRSQLIQSELASHYAKIFSIIYAETDPILIKNIIVNNEFDSSAILKDEGSTLGATDEIYPVLADFVDAFSLLTSEASDPLEVSKSILDQLLKNPEEPKWLRRLMLAIELDAVLAPVERAKFIDFTTVKDLKTLTEVVETRMKDIRAKNQLSDRSTPLGFPTDDSQFLMAGVAVSQSPISDFGKQYIGNWRLLASSNLWRNTGSRLNNFIRGDQLAMSGQLTVGDFLRFSGLAALTSQPQQIQAAFEAYSNELQLSLGQKQVGQSFLNLLTVLRSGDALAIDKAWSHLIESIRLLSQAPGAIQNRVIALFKALDEERKESGDVFSFLSNRAMRLGTDYDTYGFLAALLLNLPTNHNYRRFGLRGASAYQAILLNSVLSDTKKSDLWAIQQLWEAETQTSTELNRHRTMQ